MALVRRFTQRDHDRVSLHDEVEATYTSFERDGRVLLQIDTYGRNTRQVPGKLESNGSARSRRGGSSL